MEIVKVKVVPVHAVKSYRGSAGIPALLPGEVKAAGA
jgi:hypothetical protein